MVSMALFSSIAVSSTFAFGGCFTKGGTTTVVNNSNFFWGAQTSHSFSWSGGNSTFGNIGGGDIYTSPATSTTTMTMTNINRNTTNISVATSGATNNVSLVNTGPFVSVCAGAAN